MNSTITSFKQIPQAPFYVLAEDTFLSGWGDADGKINTLLLPCASKEEAEIVKHNAKSRPEMVRVRIENTRPPLSKCTVYSLHTKDDYSRWYIPHSFCKCPKEAE